MCDRCGWRELVAQIKELIREKPRELPERQQVWIETIGITVDDDRHCSDHQKSVVKRILRERKIARWRLIPKATDKTEWSDAKRKRYAEGKRMSARLRRHGGF